MNFNQAVSAYILSANEKQIPVLEELRQMIHETVPQVSEDIKWKMPVFNHGKNFAYLRFSKNHITLGFYHIDKIIDPDHLLEGEGNTLKHIKITTLDSKLKIQIKEWIKQITAE